MVRAGSKRQTCLNVLVAPGSGISSKLAITGFANYTTRLRNCNEALLKGPIVKTVLLVKEKGKRE